jgi:transcriptional regulator with GAF, ATPase, and Fis domain
MCPAAFLSHGTQVRIPVAVPSFAPGTRGSRADRRVEDLNTVQRTHIETILERCRWRINGPGNAAERLGMHPNTLRYRIKKLGVRRPNGRRQGVRI